MADTAVGRVHDGMDALRRRRTIAWIAAVVIALICVAVFAAASLWSAATPARVVSAVTGVEALGFEGVVRQRRRNDCGAAALATVLASFGRHIPLDVLERELPIEARGVSMLALRDSAVRHGLQATGWRVGWDALGSIRLPAIAFVNGDHFVVVLGASSSNVELADPARGRLRLTRRAFERRWRGEILTFRPLHDGGD